MILIQKIKKFIFSFALLVLCYESVLSQEAKVEKNITAINFTIAPTGASISHELRLASRLSLKGELGLNYYYAFTRHLLFPYLNLQTRWYYNLYKRERKSKKTFGNSANFFGLYGAYQPEFPSLLDKEVSSKLAYGISPIWGIRRQLGKKISFECYIGYPFLGLNFGYNFY